MPSGCGKLQRRRHANPASDANISLKPRLCIAFLPDSDDNTAFLPNVHETAKIPARK
jgi:hypothetical protein